MGWMKIDEVDGHDITIGDEPADLLANTLDRIVELYQKNLNRKPRPIEIERLFLFVFRPFVEDLS